MYDKPQCDTLDFRNSKSRISSPERQKFEYIVDRLQYWVAKSAKFIFCRDFMRQIKTNFQKKIAGTN